jgi:hypothetical protein
MRTNAPMIQRRMKVNLETNGTKVKLSWTVTTGATVDPVTRALVGGTATMMCETRKAFVHSVQIGRNQVQQFNEIEIGDMILDFAGDVQIDGRPALTFTLPDGTVLVNKPVGDRLARSWDVIVRGQKLFRPVLVRKQT